MVENSTFVPPSVNSEEISWDSYLLSDPVTSNLAEMSSNMSIVLPEVPRRLYRNQMSESSFSSFNDGPVSEYTGYNAKTLRENGCGITALWMVLSTLNPDFSSEYDLDRLAFTAVMLHRNDETNTERIFRKGRLVFSPHTGWYHDALCHLSSLGNLEAFRVQNVQHIIDVARVAERLVENGRRCLVIASVRNKYWRSTENESQSTHLVVLNGFKVGNEEDITEVRIVDSFPEPDPYTSKPKINEWITCDQRIRNAFTGKYMIFYTSN